MIRTIKLILTFSIFFVLAISSCKKEELVVNEKEEITLNDDDDDEVNMNDEDDEASTNDEDDEATTNDEDDEANTNDEDDEANTNDEDDEANTNDEDNEANTNDEDDEATTNDEDDESTIDDYLPACINEILMDTLSLKELKTVQTMEMDAEKHYWLNTDSRLKDFPEYIVNEKCDTICSFGSRGIGECWLNYNIDEWQIIWQP